MNHAHITLNDCISRPFQIDAEALSHEDAVEHDEDRRNSILRLSEAMQYENFSKLDYADDRFAEYRNRLLGYIARLIALGANVSAIDYNGWSPLMVAALHNDIDLARMLVEHGADPWHENAQGQSPAHIAGIHHQEAVSAYFQFVRLDRELPSESAKTEENLHDAI